MSLSNVCHSSRRQILTSLAALAVLAVPALAQEKVSLRRATHIRVLPGRGAEFRSAVMEYNKLLAKGGWNMDGYFFQSTTGPAEYVLVRNYKGYAELDKTPVNTLKDQSVDLARVMARIQSCSETSESEIRAMVPDLSLPRPQTPAKYVRIVRTRVRPDKVEDYVALMKSTMMPAVKKAALTSYSTSRIRYGGQRNDFFSSAGFDSYAELDGTPAIVKAMGEDGFKQFNDKLRVLTLSQTWNIYRYVPEMSYRPGTPTTPSGD